VCCVISAKFWEKSIIFVVMKVWRIIFSFNGKSYKATIEGRNREEAVVKLREKINVIEIVVDEVKSDGGDGLDFLKSIFNIK
jgi:hypothetical protein